MQTSGSAGPLEATQQLALPVITGSIKVHLAVILEECSIEAPVRTPGEDIHSKLAGEGGDLSNDTKV